MQILMTCPDCDIEHEFEVRLGKPAPFAQDHDSPLFSQSGEPDELEGDLKCPCGFTFEESDIFQKASDDL